jgi:hypothetical protein
MAKNSITGTRTIEEAPGGDILAARPLKAGAVTLSYSVPRN